MKPLFTSMPSKVGLEPTNFVNPDLTWNRVAKGQRSASRRSRKPAGSLDMGVQLDGKSPKRVEDFSVSESEEVGVAVLGRRFADKVENVPLKKRRLVLWSESPPQQISSSKREDFVSPQPQLPSQYRSEPKQHCLDSRKCASGRSMSNQGVESSDCTVGVELCKGADGLTSGKLSEVTGGKIYNDDFSGIALLAAAACNNSFDIDANSPQGSPLIEGSLTPEGIGSSVTPALLKETIVSSGESNAILNNSGDEENIDRSFVQNDNVDVSQNCRNDKDGGLVKEFVCSKDKRLHWDLNTVMDAWEQPLDACNVDTQINISERIHDDDDARHGENLENVRDCELESDFETGQYNMEKEAQSSSRMVSGDRNSLLVCSSATGIAINESSGEPAHSGVDLKASNVVVSAESSLHNSSISESDYISSSPISLEKVNTVSNVEDRTSILETVQIGKHQNLSSDSSVPREVTCEIGSFQIKDDNVSAKTANLPDNRTSPREMVSSVTCQVSDFELSVNNFNRLNPPTDKDSLALDAFAVEGQPMVSYDLKGQEDKASKTDTLVDSPLPSMPMSYDGKVPITQSGKIETGDPFDDCDNSGISHDGRGSTVNLENVTGMQAGYDSPFEDGELREPVFYPWDEKEAEWETECVDYESDNGGEDDLDTTDYSVSEKVEKCPREDSLKDSHHSLNLKTKVSGWDQLPEGCEYSIDRSGEVDDVNARKKLTSDCLDRSNDNIPSTREFGSKESRGSLFSHMEENLHSGELHRKDDGHIRRCRSNNHGDLYFRAGRDFGSGKFLDRDRSALKIHDRGQQDGHLVSYSEGYRDSKDHFSSWFHRYDPRHTRTRSHVADSVGKMPRLTRRDPRQPINYSSKGVFRPRSSVDRDGVYGMNRGIVPARDMERFRGRGRSRIHPQGVSKGPREEYYGTVLAEPSSSSDRVPFYPSSRERSVSPPIHTRGAYFSRHRRRSRSRSRTHSPLSWNLQQERSFGTRRHSRSPDFRSEARMKRSRLPFQKSSFATDEEERFMPSPRGRFFPQCNSRWFGERNCPSDRFRDRSPGRIFRQSQRLDVVNSPERLKSDNYFRPIDRTGRYSEMAGGRGRRRDA